MSQPIISVCIPVYNGERFISETIRSVLAQDFQDYELIISDNASTDGTQDLALGVKDARLLYSRSSTNVGAIGNFQRCLDLARGRYMKIICSDDIIYPTCLSRQLAVLQADSSNEIALVSCSRDVIDEKNRIQLKPRIKHFSGRIDARQAIIRTIRRGTNIFCEPHAILFRTAQAREAGGFSPKHGFCLDMDFAFRLLRFGDLYRMDDALSAFRVSSTSWSTSIANRQHIEFAEFVDDFQANGWMKLSAMDMRMGKMNAFKLVHLRRLYYRWMAIRRSLGL